MALFKPGNTTYKTTRHNSFINKDSMLWLKNELLDNENSMFDYIKRLVRASKNCKIRTSDVFSSIKEDTGEDWGIVYEPKYGSVEELIRNSHNSGLEYARNWIILAEEEMMAEETKTLLTSDSETKPDSEENKTKIDMKVIVTILTFALIGFLMFNWKNN